MKHILPVLLLISSITTNAQPHYSSDQVIALDLLNPAGPFPKNFSIKKNVRIRYLISNINRNVYTVSVNSESKSLFTEKPPIFSVITDIDMSKLSPPLPGDPAGVTGLGPLGIIDSLSTALEKQIIVNYQAEKRKVNAHITAYKNRDEKLKKLKVLYATLNETLNNGADKFADLFKAKQDVTVALLTGQFSYAGSTTDDVAILASLRLNTETLLDQQVQEYRNLLVNHSILKQHLALLEQLVTSKKKELTGKLPALNPANKKIVQQGIEDITLELAIEKLIENGITEVVNDIKVNQDNVNEHIQSGFVQALATVYRRISLGNWQYVSPSILGEKDELVVKLSIEAKNEAAPTPNYGMFNGEIKGDVYGFKLNFSTGIFLLASKKLFDKSYRIDTITGNLENNVIAENEIRESLQPAVGALMHFYMKRSSNFNWGGNLGFSVSSQTRLNYHGGLSFLFGNEQRIIANIGMAVSQVKEIASSYRVGQEITRSSGLNTVPTENFYRVGIFAAVTFNLSNP